MATVTLKEAMEIIWKRYSGLYAYIEQETGINGSTFRNAYEGKSQPELPTINKIVESAMKIVEEDVTNRLVDSVPAQPDDKKYRLCQNCKIWKETSEFERPPTQDPLSYCYKCRFASMRKSVQDEERIKDDVIRKNQELAKEMFERMNDVERFKGIVDDVSQELAEMLSMIRKRTHYDVV